MPGGVNKLPEASDQIYGFCRGVRVLIFSEITGKSQRLKINIFQASRAKKMILGKPGRLHFAAVRNEKTFEKIQ
jgi:hypothetical protein